MFYGPIFFPAADKRRRACFVRLPNPKGVAALHRLFDQLHRDEDGHRRPTQTDHRALETHTYQRYATFTKQKEITHCLTPGYTSLSTHDG